MDKKFKIKQKKIVHKNTFIFKNADIGTDATSLYEFHMYSGPSIHDLALHRAIDANINPKNAPIKVVTKFSAINCRTICPLDAP